ncbi:YfbM family protein [Streptomyces sp. NPDC059740]|uniref:YfbM family protein n=1 Tax=Streptomyces sp. NPDC059740 TaxID=3346926 RepID=UPI00365D6EBF
MGMYLSFIRVTPQELEEAEKDPARAEVFLERRHERGADEPDGGLEKAWAGLEFLLNAAAAGVDLLRDGELISEDGRFSGWTADRVQGAAKRLGDLPFERLARHYDPQRMTEEDVYPGVWQPPGKGELAYLEEHYAVLVGFFTAAAASGSAAIMLLDY